jgi:hypothetical protein
VYKGSVIGMAISALLATIFFTLAHWLFARKYWLLSYKLDFMVGSLQQPNLKFFTRFSKVMLFNIILWPLIAFLLFLIIDLSPSKQ